ncbi:MAG: non-hydrolyzing UDP-N-acetylglucosamine 2-epimerase [Candidatus Scalindua sp.]
MKIILVAGARPNFMKVAPIIRQLETKRKTNKSIELSWKHVHTGQHYDYEMSKVFFNDLEMPEPEYFLNAGSGGHAEQTAKVMVEFEKVCVKERPDIVMVVGDVNSTLACSITAKKLNIIVAHVEAGLRSGDMFMPEEINRIVTDSISDFLFVSEKSGMRNLKNEGKRDEQIFFVGNVMIDTLYYQLNKLNDTKSCAKKISKKEKYGVVTLHRPSNVDEKDTCQGIIEALIKISKDLTIVFPVHPRTRKNLETFGLIELVNDSNIRLCSPLPYVKFLRLWKDAKVMFTDSGGIQEETTALGIPCFTIRENTERPVTVEEGTNTLVGNKKESILNEYSNFKNGNSKSAKIPELWDGKSAERIVNVILKAMCIRDS